MSILMNRRRGVGKSEVNYYKQYLTFKAIESGTFAFNRNIYYSIDEGRTWVELTANTNSPIINEGENIMFKANFSGSSTGSGKFTSTGKFDVFGNIMSLIFGDDYLGKYSLSGKIAPFYEMFTGCKVVFAENLILPATTIVGACYEYMFKDCTLLEKPPKILPSPNLVTDCYRQMFDGCSKLTSAPILPAFLLVTRCYQYMFRDCSSLNYVKALFTTTPGTSYTYNWLQRVNDKGTFVKNSSATWNVSGISGVPSGWTIETEKL